MTTTLAQQWARCQTILADNLTASAYQTWFAPIVPLQFTEGVLVLQVKSQFVAEYIEENYIPLLSSAILRVFGQGTRLEYRVLIDSTTGAGTTLPSTPAPAKSQWVMPGPQQANDDLPKLNELYTEENLVKIRDSMIVKAAISSAGSLDRECYEWSVECSNAISGSNGMLPDETVFSSKVANALPWPVSRLYTEKYLSQEDKDRISGMIDEIIEEYHGIIEEADFLSDETKEAAAGKLDAMGKGVLWPDDWSAYDSEGLEIDSAEDGGSLWDAFKAVSRFAISKDIKEYPEPVDKDRWLYPPTAVNCYYNPQANNIVILGAFARGRLYDPEMSDEELYAKLGTVIGHEISHAFDSTGAQFDKDGNMNQWWTEDDLSAFKERNDKLVAYFDKIHPWEGQDYMASIKSGEACADMGGIKCMLRIAAKKDDFDYDEFFRAYADLWDAKGTLGTTYAYIRDSHPLSYLRVNCTLQQYDEFLDFYGIEEGDGMYLAPEDRVNIW